MKTKILFFFLLLVGVGNGFAENTSRDSLLQKIENTQTLVKNEKIRSFTSRKWGVLVPKNTKTEPYSKMLVFHIILASGLLFFTNRLGQNRISIDRWVHWSIITGIFIFFSCYLGSLCALLSLFYLFKDKIKNPFKKKGKK